MFVVIKSVVKIMASLTGIFSAILVCFEDNTFLLSLL